MKNAQDCAAPNLPEKDVTYTLKVISNDAEGGLRTVLFRRVSDGEAIEISAQTDAENLLAKLPEFLEAALEIQRALWPAQRTVSRLPSSFFPRFTEESRRVRRLAAPDGASERQEIVRRQNIREAMIVRDVAWEALHSALGPRRRHEIDALPSAHEPPLALADSMERIAAYIERLLRSPEDAGILVACDIDAAYAASLRRHAGRIREAEGALPAPEEPAPRRRGFLRLIGTAYRALRTEAFMTVPEVGAWMLDEDGKAQKGRARATAAS